jgi:ATPase complex subunit ATP10
MTRKHGGKTWIAPQVLIREDVRPNVAILVHISHGYQKALYLPNITGKSLDERMQKHTTIMCFGRVTVLVMLGTKISEVTSLPEVPVLVAEIVLLDSRKRFC